MLVACRQYYHDNQAMLQAIYEFAQEYVEEKCIWWYTRDTFVYRMINRALRTADLEQLYVFRYYIADLSKQLFKRYEELKNSSTEKFFVYRGTQIHTKELEIYQDNIDKNIAINNYWSTSRSSKVARAFAGSSSHPDQLAVLFEIECDPHDENNSAIFCDISSESIFQSEKEVLFDAGSTLQIKTVEKKSIDGIELYLIQMTTSGGQREIEKCYREQIEEEMKYKSPRIMLGVLLKRIGKHEKSLKYFQDLLENPDGEKKVLIHIQIGTALRHQQKYDQALNHFNDAYESSKSDPLKSVYLVFIRHNQGQIHSRKNHTLALKRYKEAVNIITKNPFKLDQYLAVCYTSIGRVYLYEKDYEQAMHYQSEALKIRKKCLTCDHVIHAINYTEIANILSAQGNYKKALENHVRALEIRRTHLLSNNLNTASSLYHVGKMYHKLLDPNTALDHYHKALEMKRKCLPDSSPYITPDILRDMALIYGYNSTEALEYLLEALDISVKGELVKPFKLSRLLDDIALVYKALNGEKDLLTFYERALEIRIKFLSNDKFKLARLLEDMTNMYRSRNNREDLLEFYERALEIRKKFLFNDKFNLARLLDDIAYTYNQMKRLEDSLQFYERALEIRQENLTNDQFNLTHSFRHIASLHERLQNMPSAVYYYRELLKIYEHHYHYNHRNCVTTRNDIGRMNRRMR